MISCILGAHTRAGVRVSCPTKLSLVDDAIRLSIKLHRPNHKFGTDKNWHPRDEPPWHNPNSFLSLAAKAQLTNADDLNSTFSAGFRAFDHLPVYRNYYAHRSRDTRDKAMNLAPSYGTSFFDKPSHVLLSVPVNQSSSVLESWISEVSLTIEAMCA